MKTINESLTDFCKTNSFELSMIVGEHRFIMGSMCKTSVFLALVFIDEENRKLQVETIIPLRVPKNKRNKIMELMVRINNNLLLGNFELDIDTGLISYKTSITLGQCDLHPDLVRPLFFANWAAADKYLPAIAAVIFKDVDPLRAISIANSQADNSDEKTAGMEKYNRPFGWSFGDLLGKCRKTSKDNINKEVPALL